MIHTSSRDSTRPASRAHRRRRRLRRPIVAVMAAATLAGGVATFPSSAQIPDAGLGFEITPVTGAVGDTVEGTVDVDDVNEHCITDPKQFVESIVAEDGSDTPYAVAMSGWVEDPDNEASAFIPVDTPNKLAAAVSVFAPFGLASSAFAGDGEMAEEAMNQTFVMAFADLATFSPIDPIGNFDPTTGEGSVEVPGIAPGNHPVVATCVGLPDEISDEAYYAAMDATIAFIDNNYEQPYPAEWNNVTGDEFAEVAGEIFPVLLRALVEPQALGLQMFCVDDGTGSCDEPETPDPTDPQTPPGEDGEGNGEGGPGAGGGGGSQAPGATPVTGRPSYTG